MHHTKTLFAIAAVLAHLAASAPLPLNAGDGIAHPEPRGDYSGVGNGIISPLDKREPGTSVLIKRKKDHRIYQELAPSADDKLPRSVAPDTDITKRAPTPKKEKGTQIGNGRRAVKPNSKTPGGTHIGNGRRDALPEPAPEPEALPNRRPKPSGTEVGNGRGRNRRDAMPEPELDARGPPRGTRLNGVEAGNTGKGRRDLEDVVARSAEPKNKSGTVVGNGKREAEAEAGGSNTVFKPSTFVGNGKRGEGDSTGSGGAAPPSL